MDEKKDLRKRVVCAYNETTLTENIMTTLSMNDVLHKFVSEENLFQRLCLRRTAKAKAVVSVLVKNGYLKKTSVVLSKKETITAYKLSRIGFFLLAVIKRIKKGD